LPHPQPDPDFADLAQARVDEERQMREILRQIAQLPEREQDVLVLCAWMGLSYQDAAYARLADLLCHAAPERRSDDRPVRA
jgi:RNA polymerase sigma-70 factor, ECF subfamily